jgi:hypothetical protein
MASRFPQYDLLTPDDVIEPYELTLKRMRSAERRSWAGVIAMRQNCDLDADEFILLAGVPYPGARFWPDTPHRFSSLRGW